MTSWHLSDRARSAARCKTCVECHLNVAVTAQTAWGTYGWTGQGKPIAVTKIDLATVTLGIAKAVGIIVVTEELINLSQPGAETLLRDELAAGLAQFTDAQFVDPSVAAVTDVSPGSILNVTSPVASAGGTAADALTDIKALIAAFTAANPDVEFAVFLMSPVTRSACPDSVRMAACCSVFRS
jgi:HK97 family phage major capsid protein